MKEDSEEEIEAGGWSGWYEPSSRIEETIKKPENLAEDAGGDEKTEEDLEMEDHPGEEDVESLLKKLGIDIDAEPQTEVNDTATWNRWAKEETSRDSAQWMPVREKPGSVHSGNPGRESNEQLSRVILYEDVSDYIFSLYSEEARFRLVSRFIDFFGGKISQWTCTNSAGWIENTLSSEAVPDSIFDNLKDASLLATQVNCDSSHHRLDFLLGGETDALKTADMMKFLRNAILLCMKSFPRNYILEEALLVAEELYITQMNSSVCSITPSRALAKGLLKNDRQVLQGNASHLYFWYADMEMAAFISKGSEIFSHRSIYILSCLGSSMHYEPFKCQASSLQLLRARQGFKEQISRLCPSWARGDIKDESIALICSAALFEILTTGWAAGLEVIEEAFSMVLPGRRSQSLQLESLFNYYIGLLQKHPKQQELSRVWSSILQGLQNYPYSPKVFSAMVEISCLYTVQHKIRRIFDEHCQRSKMLWLDGFQKLSSILTAKELSDLQEVMRDKELNLRTDIYEILLEEDI